MGQFYGYRKDFDIVDQEIFSFATSCLAVYFYSQPQPMMTVVYWNLFFMGLNAVQLGRIYKDRALSEEAEAASTA